MASRQVHHADALEWLRGVPDGSLPNIVTSLPDMSETPLTRADDYEPWFVHAATLCLQKVHPSGYVLFYQTDRRVDGRWVDKSALVHRAAEAAAVPLRWHKIVLRRSNLDAVDNLRPTYTHLQCLSARGRPGKASPDVMHAGASIYKNAMGLDAARFAITFVARHTGAPKTVVDPFCGRGTTLAVANALGLDAVGVDTNKEQCYEARRLQLLPKTCPPKSPPNTP